MEIPGTHVTCSVAADDAGTIVLQAFMRNRRILSCTFPMAEVAACGSKDASRCVGAMLFAALSGSSPTLQQYPRLLAIDVPRQLGRATMDSPPTRSAHLRISIATDPNCLILQRCTQPNVADSTVVPLSLARLALAGPDPAGHALLGALAALHPDIFVPFPELSTLAGISQSNV